MIHHATYTLPRMLEFSGFVGVVIAGLAIIAVLTLFSWIRERAAEQARTAYETRCRKAGCAHAHPLSYVAEAPPEGAPADCPFRCSHECGAGEWHCAEYHLPYSQQDHNPATCPGNALAATLARHPATATMPVIIRDCRTGWDISAELAKVHEWAERVAAG